MYDQTQRPVSPQATPFLRKLIEIVEANYADSTFDIHGLSRKLNLCPMQVHRKVKRHIGLTPGKYLLLFRLKKSQYLLRNTDLPIGEIAWQVGFCYHHTFTRAFRRIFGCSPLQMRQVLEEQDIKWQKKCCFLEKPVD